MLNLFFSENAGTQFFLIYFFLIFFSLWFGNFSYSRKVLWIMHFTAYFAASVFGFLSYIFPWSQVLGWAATQGELVYYSVIDVAHWGTIALVGSSSIALFLALDVILLCRSIFPQRLLPIIMTIPISIGLSIVWLAPFLTAPEPATTTLGTFKTPFQIIPPLQVLPYYTGMRAFEPKLAGILISAAMLLTPLAWPWMKTEKLRKSGVRWIWLAVWLVFVGNFFWMGYLGGQTPTDSVIVASRIAVFVFFIFGLDMPILLHFLNGKRKSGDEIG